MALGHLLSWFEGAVNLFVVSVLIICLRDTASASDWMDTTGCKVVLTSDEPGVYGAPIGFFARLLEVEDNTTLFTYRWESIHAKFNTTLYNQSLECNITMSAEKEGTYDMKLWVDRSDGYKLCKTTMTFHVTGFIGGAIKVEQEGIHAKQDHTLATDRPANVSFVIRDPYNYFNNSFIFYGWGVDGAAVQTTESSFIHNFSSPQDYHVMVSVTVIVNKGKPVAYFGSLGAVFTAKNPIIMSNVTGQTAIQHGDLLDIEITCEGSTPLTYCYFFTQDPVNGSSEVCKEPYGTTVCDFIILRYFKKSGNYKLVLIVDNDVDHKVNVYNINVFQRGAEPQLSPIIVPLACSSLALVIVVIGIMYYIQSRRSYTVEVADFDFQHSDNYEFHSFTERMVSACKVWFGNARLRPEKSSSYRRIQAQIT